MSEFSVFSGIPLRLVFKSKQLKSLLSHDLAAQALADRLYECALRMNAFIGKAMDADTERQAADLLMRALQKLAAARYYIELLAETGYLSDGVVNGFFDELDELEAAMEPIKDIYFDS